MVASLWVLMPVDQSDGSKGWITGARGRTSNGRVWSLQAMRSGPMVAEMIIRIPDYVDREKDLQISHKEYESFGIPEDFIQAARVGVKLLS